MYCPCNWIEGTNANIFLHKLPNCVNVYVRKEGPRAITRVRVVGVYSESSEEISFPSDDDDDDDDHSLLLSLSHSAPSEKINRRRT